jgi:cytochrome P450 family 4
LDGFQKEVLANRREALAERSKQLIGNEEDVQDSKFFIDRLIHNEEKFTPEEIHDHMVAFFSGFDNWGNALGPIILLLAMHPEAQEKLYREIQSAISSDEEMNNFDKINKIEYLDMVVKETFRLMPTAPIIPRRTVEDFEIEPGLIIPKDTNLFINLYTLHRRKDIWGDDADEFKPERFSPKNPCNRHQFSYIPFSSGARNCIGYRYSLVSMKLAAAKLIKEFKFSSNMKMSELTFCSLITLKLCVPHVMSVEDRKSC